MKAQAFVVSFYAAGERRASDCYPDFVATRSEAVAVGRQWVETARMLPSTDPIAWIARFTVKRIWL